MGMNSIKGEMEIEVIKDTTQADEVKKARRRMGLCVMSSAEQEIYGYDPNGAANSNNPAYPDEDYGETD